MTSNKNMTGVRIGNFEVCERCGTDRRGSALYTCRCDCGHVFVKGRNHLLAITRKPLAKQYCPICLPPHVNNIIGSVFDTVQVISLDYIDDRGITFWNCVCQSCNQERVYSKETLRANKHICSCQRKRYMLDLTGQKFDQITVVGHAYTNKYGQNKWKCLCSCGNEVIALSTQLTDGSINRCNECKLKLRNQESTNEAKLLIGTVLEYDYTVTAYAGQNERKEHLLELTCNKCGATKIVSRTIINQHKHGRCSCSPIYKDITGEQYGRLKAIERDGYKQVDKNTNTLGHPLWKCICSCGNVCHYTASELTNKEKQKSEPSCGCGSHMFGRSWWEIRIVAKIANMLGDQYQCIYAPSSSGRGEQYTIPYTDDKGHNRFKRYDLAIFGKLTNFIVECNGSVWHARTADQLNENGTPWTTLRGVSAYDVYHQDQFKRKLAEQNGFCVLYIWDDEDEYKSIESIVHTIKQANNKPQFKYQQVIDVYA